MTYSIVAADSAAGLVGVAAQSHHLAVGPLVSGLRRGVGAIAVQSYGDRSHYDPALFDALEMGMDVDSALSALFDSERRRRRSQIGLVTADGAAAARTGASCVAAAGHEIGVGWSVQANMCASSSVWTDAAATFESSVGDLAVRLLDALDAAEEAGGDLRGSQSASLLVVATDRGMSMSDVDLRVDDHPEPLIELRRLDHLRRASLEMTAAFVDAAAGDVDRAIERLAGAQSTFGPNVEPSAWAAVLLARAGRLEEAATYARRVRAEQPGWARFWSHLPDADLLPDDVLDALVQSVDGC